MANMTNYKDWIQQRADEIALEKYNKDFYELPDNLQMEVYNQAEEDYKDHYAAQIDAFYDMAQEARLMQVDKEVKP